MPPTDAPTEADSSSLASSQPDASTLSASTDIGLAPVTKVASDELSLEGDPYAVHLSRTSSNTSLHAKAQASEEGRMHRFGQQVQRDILPPQGLDYEHGTTGAENDSEYIAILRSKVEHLRGDEIKAKVEQIGADKVLEEMGATVEEMAHLQAEDPEAFARFKESQIAADVNALQLDQHIGRGDNSA